MAGDGELVAVRADRVVDVEAGEVRAGRVVLVRGERIEAVLDPGRTVPEGAAMVDLPGHTLLPGLIDCHTHLVGELQGSGIPAIDRSAAQEALSGVGNARATVLAGFTTVRDVGTFRAFVDVALRDAIADGTVGGPRLAVAGAYVTVPGGGGSGAGAERHRACGSPGWVTGRSAVERTLKPPLPAGRRGEAHPRCARPRPAVRPPLGSRTVGDRLPDASAAAQPGCRFALPASLNPEGLS